MNGLNGDFQIGGLPEQIAPHLKPSAEEAKSSDLSFKDLLSGLVKEVDSLQKDADQSIKGLATGETTDIHDVTIKMEEAGVAFDLMMEIRNKLVKAYQEVLKMQT